MLLHSADVVLYCVSRGKWLVVSSAAANCTVVDVSVLTDVNCCDDDDVGKSPLPCGYMFDLIRTCAPLTVGVNMLCIICFHLLLLSKI